MQPLTFQVFAQVRPEDFDSFVGSLHRELGIPAVIVMGIVGLWGLGLAVMRKEPGTTYGWGAAIASTILLAQVGMGLWVYITQDAEWAGNQHVFYGIVILFTFSFAYIYRAEFSKRPALSYGLLALFLMGLGIRGIMNFGQSFGG